MRRWKPSIAYFGISIHALRLYLLRTRITHALFDKKIAIEINKKNKAVNSVFKSLKTKGEKNIYIISSEKMLGEDGEATVDGIHFTDLGMMRYADLVCPVIKKVLKK